jgi:lysophospholipase L1-like esterase
MLHPQRTAADRGPRAERSRRLRDARGRARAAGATGVVDRVRSGALALAAGLAIAFAAPGLASAQGAGVDATDPNIRYEGHWDVGGSRAITVNSGSRIAMRFNGSRLVGLFDVSSITNPPQIYVRIDGGAPARVWVDRPSITLASGLAGGVHRVDIVVKDVDERANRWVPPLQSGLTVTGFQLDDGAGLQPLPDRRGPRMEFLGDSITQGVRAVGLQIGPRGSDATKDYAWLLGTAFGADFHQVGFGAQGIVRPGGGQVPPAPAAFGKNFEGSPAPDTPAPQVVVVNQGTNDALNGVPATDFQPAYAAYLRQLRAAWPQALIFAIRPLGGYFAAEIAASVDDLDDLDDRRILYVDTTGWLQPPDYMDGLHPTVAGHTLVAARLRRIIARRTGLHADRIRRAATALLPVGAPPGFDGAASSTWVPGELIVSTEVTSATPENGADPYDGTQALAATSAVAPLTDWREIHVDLDQPLRVRARASELFAYVSPAGRTTPMFDVRLTAFTTSGRLEVTEDTLLNLAGFLPWNRIALNLDGLPQRTRITGISVAVRGEGDSTPGRLSFQLDDIGQTAMRDRQRPGK